MPVVTGDTKVVERGKADGVFISTTGVGVVPPGLDLSGDAGAAGRSSCSLSGTIGDHGVAVMSKRENLDIRDRRSCPIRRRCTAWSRRWSRRAAPALRVMRDPTRGGLAATLNEIAQQSGVGFAIEEEAIPVRPEVAAACELLGLDPLYVANEGKLVAIVAPDVAEALLAAMRAHPLGARRRDHRRASSRTPTASSQMTHRVRRRPHRRLARRASNCRGSAEPRCASCSSATASTASTQRLHVALREAGHEVSVEFDVNDAVTREAVALFSPDLVVAPFLKRAIPEDVWRAVRCSDRPSRRARRQRAVGARLGDPRRRDATGASR